MSGTAFRPKRAKETVALNVTSLIDVLFLLLIFFMLTGTFKRAGELELQLPDSSSSAPTGEGGSSHQAELVATEEGELVLDGTPVPLADLKRQLEAIIARDSGSRVMIGAILDLRQEPSRVLDMLERRG